MKTSFGLYLILTDPVSGYEQCAAAAITCRVPFLQLRMKQTPEEMILHTARKLQKMTRGSETRLIINDNLEIAMEADADGIHLGQKDLSVPEARKRWNRPNKMFGLSTHSMDQVIQAEKLNPDYIGVGPLFPTATKSDTDPELGIAEVARIVRKTSLPAAAIGGINIENLPDILRAGIRNYCVVGAVNQSPDPASAIQQLLHIQETFTF